MASITWFLTEPKFEAFWKFGEFWKIEVFETAVDQSMTKSNYFGGLWTLSCFTSSISLDLILYNCLPQPHKQSFQCSPMHRRYHCTKGRSYGRSKCIESSCNRTENKDHWPLEYIKYRRCWITSQWDDPIWSVSNLTSLFKAVLSNLSQDKTLTLIQPRWKTFDIDHFLVVI